MSDSMRATFNTGAEVQPRPRVVLCGIPDTAEYQAVLAAVRLQLPQETIGQMESLAEFREWLSQHELPELIVLVQAWPDEFHFTELMAVPGIGPYSRVICTYGPWCISDGRSRQDFPLAVRIPVEDFSAALPRWIAPACFATPAGSPGLTTAEPDQCDVAEPILPWTASRDEIFANHWCAGFASAPVRGAPDRPEDLARVRIHSADSELCRVWLDALRAGGLQVAGNEQREDGEVVLWDVDVWNDSTAEEWRILSGRFPNTQIVALTGFAAPDFVDELQAAGAARVVSKLAPLATLVRETGRLC